VSNNAHDFMSEESPTAQALVNKSQALRWIYLWGYTTAAILQLVLRHAGMSWTTGAVARGWLRKTPITARDRIRVLTLTERSLAWVEQRSDVLLKYSELDPHRISALTINHQLLAQRITIHAARSGEISSHLTERVLAARSELGVKQPDVLWLTKAGQRIGVEVELTGKWDRRFDEFLLKTINSLSTKDDSGPSKVEYVLIATTSKAILSRYKLAFRAGQPFRTWRTSPKGASSADGVREMPGWVTARMLFRLVDENGETIASPLNVDLRHDQDQ